jgi:hypothetical protein
VKIDALWNQLGNITRIEFSARSDSGGIGWNGKGSGFVDARKTGDNQLVFIESGTWISKDTSLPFSNIFRWTKNTEIIQLEHLRYGEDNPVSLFSLTSMSNSCWKSQQPHYCEADIYDAEIRISGVLLEMNWTIIGPKKNETLRYVYQ